jgi:cysteine desulfurase / selenocysteine lyase
MTTQIPTSKGIVAVGQGIPLPLCPGLPDEAALERLASAFFAALPGAPEPSLATLFASSGAAGHTVPALQSTHSAAGGGTLPLAAPENRVVPQSFGLPGEGELKALLNEIAGSRAPFAELSLPDKAPDFYFLNNTIRAEPALERAPTAHPPFDVATVRRDFPILQERVNGRPLVWFDNAATTQKPQAVIDRLAYFYAHENSNIHRAAHELAARATDAYEAARDKVARFLGAGSSDEIIFVRGATEAINLVAKTWGMHNISPGDEIIVSLLEHHANIVPWQQLAAEKGATIRVIPVDDSGQIRLDEYQKLLTAKTKLVAVTQVSNALGTVTPIRTIVELAHRAGARVLVDGAQSVSHMRVNVQALEADFFVFSGHKIFGPTGIGALYAKAELLASMPPWQGGGNMIADVSFERTLYQVPPNKFEAGTGNIADAVGLGAALDYVERIGLENIARYEHDLLAYAMHGLSAIPGVRLIGTAIDKASVASFVLDGYRPDEVGTALNQEGIAVRSGHHCAQPILRRFGVEATVRPSLAFYNTTEEVDLLVSVVRRLTRGKGRLVA